MKTVQWEGECPAETATKLGSRLAVPTDDSAQVEGCADCLELVTKDLEDTGTYAAVTCIAGRRSPSGVLPPGGRRSGGPALTAADRVVTRPTLVFRSIFDGGVIRLVQPMTPETGKM